MSDGTASQLPQVRAGGPFWIDLAPVHRAAMPHWDTIAPDVAARLVTVPGHAGVHMVAVGREVLAPTPLSPRTPLLRDYPPIGGAPRRGDRQEPSDPAPPRNARIVLHWIPVFQEIRRWEDQMSFGDRAAGICGDNQAFPLTALYVEMTEQFYDAVSDMLRDMPLGESDRSLADTFEDTANEFVRTLKAWHDLGQRSTFARPELEQFELRARQQFFAEIDAIIDSIRERNSDEEKKKKKAKEASDSIKNLIPDSIWGIDLTWLKKVLNEILGVLL